MAALVVALLDAQAEVATLRAALHDLSEWIRRYGAGPPAASAMDR
jgi:hypothetical protein